MAVSGVCPRGRAVAGVHGPGWARAGSCRRHPACGSNASASGWSDLAACVVRPAAGPASVPRPSVRTSRAGCGTACCGARRGGARLREFAPFASRPWRGSSGGQVSGFATRASQRASCWMSSFVPWACATPSSPWSVSPPSVYSGRFFTRRVTRSAALRPGESGCSIPRGSGPRRPHSVRLDLVPVSDR